jgi:glutathione synthase/RimK-type ligase-like ATP-grasp enzyme
MNIALVTYQDDGAYHQFTVKNEDDQLLAFLQSKNLTIAKVIWDDNNVNWEQFDLVIIKSPWDYFNKINAFYAWLAQLKSKNIRVLNPIDVIQWNADKHYLTDIESAKLNLTPSIFVERGSKIDLSTYFEQLGSKKIVVKPVVSGGSKNTFKVSPENIDVVNEEVNALLAEEGFIIQPFLEEIAAHGEWSFLFFGGKFSHALLKKAKPGDFRVQSIFGGTINLTTPPTHLLASAQQYVDQFAKGCLYARVDGVLVYEVFLLMELELIEPFLFLDTNQSALQNYYNALVGLLNN